jgi:hypothetical protein
VDGQDVYVQKMEAIFIYHFANYLEWPAERKDKLYFVIGVYGETELLAEIQDVALKKQKVGGKPILIKKYKFVKDISDCDLVVIPSEYSAGFVSVLTKVDPLNIPIITEDEGYTNKGACFSFSYKGGKLNFQMNKKNLEQKGIKVSTDLERLSKN